MGQGDKTFSKVYNNIGKRDSWPHARPRTRGANLGNYMGNLVPLVPCPKNRKHRTTQSASQEGENA